MIIKKKLLGKTNIHCPKIGFGGAPIGNLFKKITNKYARQILSESQRFGINLYDTSPLYGYGLSEQRIGNFFKTLNRDQFLISTKVGRYLVKEHEAKIDRGIFKGGLNFRPVVDYTYDGVMKSFEQSIMRLNVDHIDLCLIHDVDYFTHGNKFEYYFNESLRGAYIALQKLKDQNLIRAIGIGLNDADAANKFLLAEEFDFVLLAGRYTLLDQSADKVFLSTAKEKKVGVIMAGIFNSGILAKGIKNSTYFYRPISKNIHNKYNEINEICKKFNVPIQAAAIQFPLKNENINSIILGMDDINQISKNLDYLNFKIENDFWINLKKIF